MDIKRKIAVFATGWSSEMLHKYISGIYEGFMEISADIYLFMGFPTLADSEENMQGELNIFSLPELSDFDVAFILANGMDFPGVMEEIVERCDAAGIPVIFTGRDDDGVHYFVGADNYTGARELVEHLVDEHNVKTVLYIAGNIDNSDSNMRLKAINDVMNEHNLSMPEDHVYYSDWDQKNAIFFIRDWLESGRKLPDAIICANDNLAIVSCYELRNINIKVPDDVIVTGFDNEYSARVYDPSISSVDQRFDRIGRAAADLAVSLLCGEKCERTMTISCEFVPSESCGCSTAMDFDGIRREVGRNKYLNSMRQSAFNRSLAQMEKQVLRGRNYKDISENLRRVIDINFNYFFNYEGNGFHIILDPLYEETTMDPNKTLRRIGYPEKMDVVFSMDDRKQAVIKNFKTKDIVPYIANPELNHLFICSPLHDNGGSMGYTIFTDDIDKLADTYQLQAYIERLTNILIKYKQTLSVDYLNSKLLELSETDALTKVKNRMAYQARQAQLEREISQSDISGFAIAMFDVNGLKEINDSFGHEAGDTYLVNSCKLICDTFKRSAIYRIGGDEFAVILTGSDFDARNELLRELDEKMAALKDLDIPLYEKISIASGMAEYDPKKTSSVLSVMSKADAQMYKNKRAMKVSG